MSKIRVTNICIPEVKSSFDTPIKVNIEFEALAPLAQDLNWKIIYIGSANSCKHDQILESFSFPVKKLGGYSFNVDVSPPDHKLVPSFDDLLGATLLMISAVYNEKEFFRCSYFVYNNFENEQIAKNIGKMRKTHNKRYQFN